MPSPVTCDISAGLNISPRPLFRADIVAVCAQFLDCSEYVERRAWEVGVPAALFQEFFQAHPRPYVCPEEHIPSDSLNPICEVVVYNGICENSRVDSILEVNDIMWHRYRHGDADLLALIQRNPQLAPLGLTAEEVREAVVEVKCGEHQSHTVAQGIVTLRGKRVLLASYCG
jgi:hypothetical protein